ncbi:hypothetical protein [Paracoccus sp. S1E-3]|uniref:hypothetical protein n=1 Tax=Paracoccus sp. S1E-3 TaxID=2756130 RepID=UPI0015EF55C7|nr:hypothetical protein [Paracoccus sp. S1E-3]MBA4491673.1 hypothetical protein [Paracoccus sp. S1E-3]
MRDQFTARITFPATITAVLLGLSAAQAQTAPSPNQGGGAETTAKPAITVPPGFTEIPAAPTPADLQGAAVFDAGGTQIGRVQGAVLADGTSTVQDEGAVSGLAANDDVAADELGNSRGSADEKAQDEADETMPGATDTKMADTAQTADQTAPAAQDTSAQDIREVVISLDQRLIALPLAELTVYRNGPDTRVYVAQSRAQLEARPDYAPEGAAPAGN